MDTLPDFSNSKAVLKARIEGALRERKRGLHHITLFLCMFALTAGFSIIYLNDLFNVNNNYDRVLLSDNYESDFVIELPSSFSVSASGDITLIRKSDLVNAANE